MQESRLFKMIYYLLDKGTATAPELAEKFEVSVRTIYRDIDVLSGAGIPVYTTPGKGGGISLLKDYTIDKALVSKEEQQQILMGLQSLSATSQDMDGLLLKLGALFDQNNPDWVQVDFSRWGSTDADQKKFNFIKTAILKKQLMTFHYCNSYGVNGFRQVKPAKLLYKSNAWYLQAYCMQKKDYRVFKLTRIDNITLLDTHFTDTLIPPPAEPIPSETSYPLIKMQFPPEAAYRVYDEFHPSEIQPQENGSMIVSCPLPEDSWLYGYLLSFCGSVEVIEPIHVKEKLAELAERIYHHYSEKF